MISRSGFFAGLVRECLHLRGVRGCALLVLLAALMPAAGRAQDVAEAARREKARKAAKGERQSHVYTNEDLQKAEIVSREESAAVEERKKNSDGATVGAATATPATTPVVTAPTNDDRDQAVASESLGEVARRYRREKAVRQAERASANPPASQFHLVVVTPALAEIAPRKVLSAPGIALSLPAARSIQSKHSGTPAKRDPFLPLELRRLGNVSRPAPMNESKPVSTNALMGGTAAKEFVVPNPSGAKAAVRTANTSADVVSGMKPARNSPVAMANGISVPLRLTSRPVVALSADDSIVVRAGDSLWRLSRQYSGAGARWRRWLAANPGVEEKRLRPGMRLIAPRDGNYVVLQQKASASPLRGQVEGGRYEGRQLPRVAHNSVTVRAGDSFWKIAAARYGDGRLWTCIARANAEWRDVGKIYPGQLLNLPATCGN
jgi:nucleoid-associated protein YgaU